MYVPLLTTITYLVFANKWQTNPIKETKTVLINLAITEVLYYCFSNYLRTNEVSFNSLFLNIFMAQILQDIYFYTAHRLLHVNYFVKWHLEHHRYFDAFYAWHASTIEHIFVNLLSTAFGLYFFPINYYLLPILVFLGTYSSVQNHTKETYHEFHHKDPSRCYSNFYFMDFLFKTD